MNLCMYISMYIPYVCYLYLHIQLLRVVFPHPSTNIYILGLRLSLMTRYQKQISVLYNKPPINERIMRVSSQASQIRHGGKRTCYLRRWQQLYHIIKTFEGGGQEPILGIHVLIHSRLSSSRTLTRSRWVKEAFHESVYVIAIMLSMRRVEVCPTAE